MISSIAQKPKKTPNHTNIPAKLPANPPTIGQLTKPVAIPSETEEKEDIIAFIFLHLSCFS